MKLFKDQKFGSQLHRPGFFDQILLGSFNEREFKGRMRMDVSTFEYLCSTLAPDLQRQDTRLRLAIPVQVKVAVSISRLATGNSMQCIADLYKIGLSSSQRSCLPILWCHKEKFAKEIHQLALSFHYGKICTRIPRLASDSLRGGGSGWLAYTHCCTPTACSRLLQPQRIPFNPFAGCGVSQMFVLGF